MADDKANDPKAGGPGFLAATSGARIAYHKIPASSGSGDRPHFLGVPAHKL